MKKQKISPEMQEKFQKIKSILLDKKAEDLVFLDLREIHNYLSYFIIATIKTDAQGKSIAKEISSEFREDRSTRKTANLTKASGWILEDLGEIAVHLMQEDIRSYYNLERLFGDALKIDLESL